MSRPDSGVYNFLNLFGNIMAEKIAGENRVRALYAGLAGTEDDAYSDAIYRDVTRLCYGVARNGITRTVARRVIDLPRKSRALYLRPVPSRDCRRATRSSARGASRRSRRAAPAP